MVTVITRTIGPSGRDYASFTLAEADVTNIGTSADLVANDEAIVFEADAGTYSESVTFQSTLTTDATRQVTYKPAAGSEHGGLLGAGVHIVGTGSASCIRNYDNYTSFVGLSLLASGLVYGVDSSGVGVTLDSLTIRSGYRCIVAYSDSGRPNCELTVTNTVMDVDPAGALPDFAIIAYADGATAVCDAKLVNCTVTRSASSSFYYLGRNSGTLTGSLTNCVSLAVYSYLAVAQTGSTVTVTGSNNFGGSANPFPVALQGSPYPITASTAYDPGSGDFALYVGKNGALLDSPNNDVINGGVGPASNSDVPTTDILGDTRSGTTTNPGAFALAQATAVLTRTIGPVGRDYATFTAAEADVENIPASADLVFENERIEFLADAATYVESVAFSSSLTTDATRQVTYKPAAGSEHGGVFGGGVVLTATGGTDNQLQDDYMTLDGLEFTASGVIGSVLQVQPSTTGVSVTRGLISNPSYKAVRINEDVSSLSLVNCVFSTPSQESIYILESSGTTTFSVVNCTFLRAPAAATGKRAIFMSASGTASVGAEFINCLALEVDRVMTNAGVTPTGSNNFGGATNPFPAAIQGSPYPITPTTNTTPGFGDYAIYVPGTGALVVVDDNAALGGGVGPAANADVPVFDINGVKRIGGGCDPGAFEGVRSRSTDVWDVMYGSHNIPGTFGKLVQDIPEAVPSAEEIATAVWNKLIADHQGAGSFGELSQQTKLAADRAGTQRLQ